MLDTMFGALFGLLSSPHIMGLMLIGVVCGLLVGVTPGIGGKLSIAMAIPFVYGMDMVAGAVFLLTMHAVNGTSGQISSIMFGIPGDGDDAATTLDGYPLAKKGQAARALGASITASGVGGIIGAIVFAVMIPILEPIVLQFSPAEFFLIALLGISFIAFLSSGDKIVKGLIVGLWGLMLSTVGTDPQTGTPRYAGDMLFLWDGVSLVTAVLALFAVPELIALGTKGGSISAVPMEDKNFSYRQLASGVMEVPRHWWLVLRTSVIGAVIGMIPGLGGSAAAWLCYGHAVQSSKTPERFGKGAIEGVIAPETASNGKEDSRWCVQSTD
jgi:putative tricarboxylic transport membrane protein